MKEIEKVSQSNATLVRILYEAFIKGDFQKVSHLIAPDYILHIPGKGLAAGDHWGVDGLKRFMDKMANHIGDQFQMEVPVLSVHADNVFTQEIVKLNRGHDPKRHWTLRISNYLKIRDGFLSESWVIPEDQRLYDEFWTIPSSYSQTESKESTESRRLQDLSINDKVVSWRTLKLINTFYRALWKGNMHRIRKIISEDIIVNIPGRTSISGVYRGWHGFLQFSRQMMALAGDKYKLDILAFAASKNDAWATEYIRMNKSWDANVQKVFVQMHFQFEDGKITQMNNFPFDLYQWEEFLQGPIK